MRTNATDWTEAYRPYIQGIAEEVVPNQVTKGGPVLSKWYWMFSAASEGLKAYSLFFWSGANWLASILLEFVRTTDAFSQTTNGPRTRRLERILLKSRRNIALQGSSFSRTTSFLLQVTEFSRITPILNVNRTYNDPDMDGNFINGTGAVDIYGMVSRLYDGLPPPTYSLSGFLPSKPRLCKSERMGERHCELSSVPRGREPFSALVHA